jgi:antirestriction protein ArdC
MIKTANKKEIKMAKKDTNKKSVNKIITESIIAKLKEGTVAWRKTWIGGINKSRPLNWFTKKHYTSGINLFIHHFSKFDCPYYATFNQISKAGGKVKKGSKSTAFYMAYPSYSKNGKYINANQVPQEIRDMSIYEINRTTEEHGYKAWFSERYISVFNLEQVEGIKHDWVKPEPVEAKENEILEEAQKIIDNMPQRPALSETKGCTQPCYQPFFDRVEMPVRNNFEGSEAYYSTMFHELAHSTGHESRLAREGVVDPVNFGSEKYSKEELVAELTACFLCADTGISPAVIENQASYIKGWVSKLEDDENMIMEASKEAQKAFDFILGKKKK